MNKTQPLILKLYLKFIKRFPNQNHIIFFYLLEHILKINYLKLKNILFLKQNLNINNKDYLKFKKLIFECFKQPWQYVIQKTLFCSTWYSLLPNIFIPTSTSEKIIQIIQKYVFADNKINFILELGTGSGVILASLQKINKNAHYYGIDIDPLAIKNTKQNVLNCKLFLQDWLSVMPKEIINTELIVANPPYVGKNEATYYPFNKYSKLAIYGNKSNVLNYYLELIIKSLKFKYLKYICFEIPDNLIDKLINNLLVIKNFVVKIFSTLVPNIKILLLKNKNIYLYFLNNNIQKLQNLLKKNKIIVCPTDTCYGILGKYNEINKIKINKIKGRTLDTNIPVLFNNVELLSLNNKKKEILKNFYKKLTNTRPVTIVFNNTNDGYRYLFAKNHLLFKILSKIGPLYASSFNFHNEPIINKINYRKFKKFKNIKAIFWDKNFTSLKPSKIIKFYTKNKFEIIRN